MNRLVPFVLVLAFLGVFLKGFLIIRRQVASKSTCIDPPVRPFFDWSELSEANTGCWLPTTGPKKLVLLIIDALRFDFTVPCQASECKPYRQNNLTVMHEHVRQKKGTLMQFIADPPTATAQRLAAITCGTLPTFIEASANFSESSPQQDSIVHQLLSHPRFSNFYFFGDDTWMHMFPEIAAHAKGTVDGYWSFGLFDLHTVDTGIKEGFKKTAHLDKDVLIAHFLGLDHCGHKHGPSHPNCSAKLREMNQVVGEILAKADASTLVFVAGDHGMTEEGDHGGMSSKEVTAALFSSISNAGGLETFLARINGLRMKYLADAIGEEKMPYPAVTQVDITATIALLLGLPIPFGNLGNVIPELLMPFSCPECSVKNLKYLVDAVRLTSHQTTRYIREYGRDHSTLGFERSDIQPFLSELAACEEQLLKLKDSPTEDALESVFVRYFTLNQNLLEHCRSMWAHFSMPLMYTGLIGMAVVVLILMVVSVDFSLVIPCLHAAGLFTTSFVIFEEWTVRFFLAGIVAFAKADLRETLLSLLLIRFSSWTGVCREEQFPFCSAIYHRNISFGFTAENVVAAAAFLLSLACFIKTRAAKSGNVLFLIWTVLLFAVWGWRWAEEMTHFAAGPTVSFVAKTVIPRVLYVSTILCILARRNSLDALLVLLASVQRPFGGYFLLVWASVQLDVATQTMSDSLAAAYYSLFALQYFFTTGHQATLNSIQWESAFAGFEGQTSQALSLVLLLLNTFAGPILASAHVARCRRGVAFKYLRYQAILLVAGAAGCLILLRHLMIWKIFAPRLLMQVISFVLSLVVLILFK